MTSTILGDIHSRQTAIDLLNEYLTQTPQLKLVTILTIKGNIGMLYMSNEDYGDSIYVFHEIIAKAEKIKNPDVRARLKIQSYEYLGNMYAELSDEKAAINEYNRAINEVVEDPKINAACKYGSYINKVESYIQLKNYSKALEASMEIDEIIPNLTPEIATGVEIFKNKNLAIIKSHQEKFEEAQQHLQICGELLEKDNNSAFLDSEMYVKFAYYEFLIENNQTSLAIEELNTLLSQSANQGMGFNNHIYTLLAKLYRKTGQMNEYMKVSAKIHKNEDHFNDTLKKDYLKYVEESFNLNQLREKEKLYQNGIILLLGIILVCVLVGAIAIIFLTKSRRNNLKDALTGIYNRKYLTVFIKKNLKTSSNMTIIMGDIDYFKNYNDTYGHPAGDVAIQAVAELLKESIRGNDKLIRYGGEEFLILMENIDLEGIDKVCKRIIRNTQEKHIVHEDSKAAKYLTLSLGVAQKVVKNELDLKQGIEEADQALYRAKQNGRNQYIIYHSDEL
ncbi:MAG: diguanylate cyclase [Lachnospiraceae bacterium]